MNPHMDFLYFVEGDYYVILNLSSSYRGGGHVEYCRYF